MAGDSSSASSELAANLGPFAYAIPVIATSICIVTIVDSKSRGNNILAGVLAVWFAVAVHISLQDYFFTSPIAWTKTKEEFDEFIIFTTLPIVPVFNFYLIYRIVPQFREYLLQTVPAYAMIGLQVYRVAGGCFLYLYYYGSMPNYTAWQTGVLDLLIGSTALPLALWVKRYGLQNITVARVVTMWNALGLFDLASAFSLVFLNFFGYYNTEPGLSIFAFYPISLIVLFQVPIAMIIHMLFLTQLELMIPPEADQKND